MSATATDSLSDISLSSSSDSSTSEKPRSSGWLKGLFVIDKRNHPETIEEIRSRAGRRGTMLRNMAKASLVILPLLAIAAIILGLHYGGVVSAEQIFNHNFTVAQGLGIFGGGSAASVVGLYLGFKGIDYLRHEDSFQFPLQIEE